MIALVNGDLALLIVGAWTVLAFLTGPIIGRMIRGPRTPRFENPGERERLGPLTEDRAERDLRVRRAMARKAEAERARMEEAA